MIELHRHLLGSIRLDTLWELGNKYQINEIQLGKSKFKNIFYHKGKISSLSKYIKPWEVIRKIVNDFDDIYRIAYEAAMDAHKEGISYIEFRNTPAGIFKYEKVGPQLKLPTLQYLNSIKEGFQKAMEETGIVVKLILSIQRHLVCNLSNLDKIRLTDEYIKIYDLFKEIVVGIDLTGVEIGYPTRNFNIMFSQFASNKIPITIHSGETETIKQVRDTLKYLYPNRIGHGLAIAGNIELMEEVKSKKIAIEICPTSNWIISKYKSIEEHPFFPYILSKDLDILICTDNPTVCNTSLSNEIKITAKALKIEYKELVNRQFQLCKTHSFSKKIR